MRRFRIQVENPRSFLTECIRSLRVTQETLKTLAGGSSEFGRRGRAANDGGIAQHLDAVFILPVNAPPEGQGLYFVACGPCNELQTVSYFSPSYFSVYNVEKSEDDALLYHGGNLSENDENGPPFARNNLTRMNERGDALNPAQSKTIAFRVGASPLLDQFINIRNALNSSAEQGTPIEIASIPERESHHLVIRTVSEPIDYKSLHGRDIATVARLPLMYAEISVRERPGSDFEAPDQILDSRLRFLLHSQDPSSSQSTSNVTPGVSTHPRRVCATISMDDFGEKLAGNLCDWIDQFPDKWAIIELRSGPQSLRSDTLLQSTDGGEHGCFSSTDSELRVLLITDRVAEKLEPDEPVDIADGPLELRCVRYTHKLIAGLPQTPGLRIQYKMNRQVLRSKLKAFRRGAEHGQSAPAATEQATIPATVCFVAEADASYFVMLSFVE